MAGKQIYKCPLCGNPLIQVAQSFQCHNQHNFDIARQGYVNLLVVQQKKSKNPGDNKEMIAARQRFLDSGKYDCLIQPCARLLARHLKGQATLLDIGCGDGYFTVKISEHLDEVSAYGLDISKQAILAATKRSKKIHWLVASSKDVPFLDHSLSTIMKINAPAQFDSLRTRLKTGGVILSVTPGAKHLKKLKALLYHTPRPHQPEPAPAGWSLIDRQQVESEIHLSEPSQIRDLLLMTPYAWNIPRDVYTKITKLEHLDTPIAFQINLWQPKDSA